MAAWAVVAGCHHEPSPRERVLARLPGAAQLVVAADATALADPGVRRAIEAVRGHVPASFGCVVDYALEADAAALAVSRTVGAVVVISTRAAPRSECRALSWLGDDLWAATIGDAVPAPAREASVLEVSRWDRVRAYLRDEPLALALDANGVHAVAAARPHPLEAWLAIDGSADAANTVERRVLAAGLIDKIGLTRTGDQIVIRAHHLGDDDLAALAPKLAALADPPPPPAEHPSLACPTGVVRCVDATHYQVAAVGERLRALSGPAEPEVVAGAIVGLRLTADADWLLQRGDVLLGIDGAPVRSAADLDRAATRARGEATVAFRRRGADFVVHLAGTNE